jgi:hypothetical protein
MDVGQVDDSVPILDAAALAESAAAAEQTFDGHFHWAKAFVGLDGDGRVAGRADGLLLCASLIHLTS